MKVLLVGAYPPPHGGVQVHLAQLERFLESQGHSCFVINLGKNKALVSAKVVSPKNALEVAFYLIKKRDHVCHLHFGGTLHTKLLLLLLFSNLVFHNRCIITIHSGGLPVWGRPKNPIKKLLFRLSFMLCRAVICVNPKIAEFFHKVGLKSEKIRIIYPFSFENDLTTDPLPEPVNSFIKGKKSLVCNIGLLEPEYDLEFLIKVFKRFIAQNPDAGLVMIGSGSLYSALQNIVNELGFQNNVLLTGDLSHADALEVLRSSDCYIRASRYDGDCISLKEAIYLGVPAIASDTGMRPKEAILFLVGDEEGLLKCMVEVSSAPPKLKENYSRLDLSSLGKVEKILLQLL